MALSKDEIALIKSARAMEEMIRTDGWKEFQKILDTHCALRLQLILRPAHDFDKATAQTVVGELDGMTRYGALEHIKGAYNAMKLVLSIPQTMVDEMKALHEREQDTPDGDEK